MVGCGGLLSGPRAPFGRGYARGRRGQPMRVYLCSWEDRTQARGVLGFAASSLGSQGRRHYLEGYGLHLFTIINHVLKLHGY